MSIAPIGIVQMAYLVLDLEQACARFNALYGWGPFVGGAEGELCDHVYRGAPAAPIRIRGVFAQSGSLNVEIIQLLSDAPSAFHDMVSQDGQPVAHHCAAFAQDYQATRDRFVTQGFPVASEFTFAGRHICYIDTRAVLGHMTEIYPELPLIRAMYAEARDASDARPGDPAIIPFGVSRQV